MLVLLLFLAKTLLGQCIHHHDRLGLTAAPSQRTWLGSPPSSRSSSPPHWVRRRLRQRLHRVPRHGVLFTLVCPGLLFPYSCPHSLPSSFPPVFLFLLGCYIITIFPSSPQSTSHSSSFIFYFLLSFLLFFLVPILLHLPRYCLLHPVSSFSSLPDFPP